MNSTVAIPPPSGQLPARARSDVRDRIRRRAPVSTTDPVGLAAFVGELEPHVRSLRALAEDATEAPSRRRYTRQLLRRSMLKCLRELEARIAAASTPQSA